MYDYDVIIPCYKGKQFIKNCLSDHINQTFKPKTIIFINDGDKNINQKTIDSYFVNTKINCRYIENKTNIGAINSILIGLMIVSSDYFKISAIDDRFEEDMAEKTLNFFTKHPKCGLAMSYPGYFLHESNKKISISLNFNKKKFLYIDSYSSRSILIKNFFKPHSQTIFFNTQIFRDNNIFKEEFGYMADLLNNYYLMLNYGFCIIPYNLAFYGIHKQQWSANINRFEVNFHIKILDMLQLNYNKFYNDLKILKLYVDLSIFDILKINSKHKKFIGLGSLKKIFVFNIWDLLKKTIGIQKIYKIYNYFN